MRSDGTVEVGLPVSADGTVARGALAHETEHLRQIAQAKQTGDPGLIENLAAAQRQGAEVERLESAVLRAPDAASRSRLHGELDQARAAYANNPVEQQARAAGLRAEAQALQGSNPRLADKLTKRAAALDDGSARPVVAGTGKPPETLTLRENPSTTMGELEGVLREDAQAVLGQVQGLNQRRLADNPAKLTTAAQDELDALAAPTGALGRLKQDAIDLGADPARLLGPAAKADLVAGPAALKALGSIDQALAARTPDIAVKVATRAEAEQVMNEMLKRQGFVETSGLNARIGRKLFGELDTFHWDSSFGTARTADGRPIIAGHEQAALSNAAGLHHATTPHLQFTMGATEVRVFIGP
jgi:hypothetical protein